MALLSNILTALFYCVAIGLCGWNAYYPNSSWREAGIASAQMLGGFVVLVLAFDAFMHSLHAPEGRLGQWLRERQKS